MISTKTHNNQNKDRTTRHSENKQLTSETVLTLFFQAMKFANGSERGQVVIAWQNINAQRG
jgi:hypothetical protein